MKVLMITQKIDADDDILGVYHEWAREIAKSFDKLSVICLYQGKTDLPEDIRIFSLGKEKEKSKILYIKNFYKYIFSLRNDYDIVFVHMNPVYVMLGWLLWRVFRKKIFLWYAHPAWNWKVKVAYVLSDKVITSVPEAFHIRGGKVVAVGQGIDMDRFRRRVKIHRDENAVLFLGRISASKRIDTLLSAMKVLADKEGETPTLHIVGDPPESPGLARYFHNLVKFVKSNSLDKVTFHKAVPNIKAFEWYNKCGIFVNLSPVGHFDKTVLEAMACECLTIVSNEAYRNVFPQDLHDLLIFEQDNVEDLARKIQKTLELSLDRRNIIAKRLREVVVQDHSITTLGKRLSFVFSNR